MLQASSQASWIPPSTKAAAEVKCASDLLPSSLILFPSIPAPYKTTPHWNRHKQTTIVQEIKLQSNQPGTPLQVGATRFGPQRNKSKNHSEESDQIKSLGRDRFPKRKKTRRGKNKNKIKKRERERRKIQSRQRSNRNGVTSMRWGSEIEIRDAIGGKP